MLSAAGVGWPDGGAAIPFLGVTGLGWPGVQLALGNGGEQMTPRTPAPDPQESALSTLEQSRHLATALPGPKSQALIERKEGFTGPIVLDMAGVQSRHSQGIRGPAFTVAANADKVL